MPLSDALLIMFILLFLAMAAACLCRHISIPYSVLLVILGLAINLSNLLLPKGFSISHIHLTHGLIIFVFLPSLIFDVCFMPGDARGLIKNLLPAPVLAIPDLLHMYTQNNKSEINYE